MTRATLVYSGRTTNWPVVFAGLAGGLALVLFGRPWDGSGPGMIAPIGVVLGILVLGLVTSTSLRVTTGPRGVQVYCGAFGWPRFTYPRERITGCEVVEVSIWRSWNYGVNWTPRGGWAYVLRSGPALRLTLTNGRHVTVGVTDAQAALDALGVDLTGAATRTRAADTR
jgi:hypothetical protein